MRDRLKFWHGIVLGAVLLFLFNMKGCIEDRNYDKLITKIENYQDSVKYYTARDKSQVAFNNNLEVKLDALLEVNDTLQRYLDNLKFRDVESITTIKEVLRIDTVEVPLNISDCDFDTTVNVKEDHYSLQANITDESLLLSNILIPNEMTYVIGYKKDKFWKKKERVVTVTNSNPYIQNTGLSSFTIVEDKKWWEKGWVKVVGGAVIGGTIVYVLTK